MATNVKIISDYLQKEIKKQNQCDQCDLPFIKNEVGEKIFEKDIINNFLRILIDLENKMISNKKS